MLLRRIRMTDEQRDLITGVSLTFSVAVATVLIELWLIASVVVGTVVLGKWIAGGL